MTPELSRPIKIKALSDQAYEVTASEAERAALARRFDLPEVTALAASVTLTPDGANILAQGTLTAAWVQHCAVSGEEFPTEHSEAVTFRFVPAKGDFTPDEEIELDEDECDEIEYEGDSFDLGEAVAQSFGLAIDPYATGPEADRVRKDKGIQIEGEQDGPLAELLAGLKKD